MPSASRSKADAFGVPISRTQTVRETRVRASVWAISIVDVVAASKKDRERVGAAFNHFLRAVQNIDVKYRFLT